MIRIPSIFRRALLRLALVGGLLSAMLLFAAKPMRAATPAQDQVSRDFQQSGEGVRIKTIYPEEEKKWFHSSRHSSWSVSYDIAMPSDAPITVRNSFGIVEVSGVHGAADVENGYGTVNVRNAGTGRWNNAFGSIELTGAGGNGAVTLTDAASANITTSFGSVEARNIRGDLSVRDNNGNVEISGVGGSADITDSFGNVSFADVHGRVNCTTNNGRVKGSSVTGGSVTIRDSFGNIELDTISGTLDAETSNGRISVRDARGSVTLKSSFGAIEASNIPKGIRAVTGNGGISLTDIGGDTFAKTSFGSVMTDRISGNLVVENSNGAVTTRNVKGDASVNTSFAGVTLESIGGRITVDNQNGAISVTATRPSSGCRDISLKTSFSSIRVRIPGGLGYNLTARTSFGRISSELPVTSTGSIGGDTLNGTIGPGGCQLQLTDSNGSIEIAKAP